MARILLGVSGGVAAYKALEFVRLATAAGHAVRVVQTPASRRFVGAASFAALSGGPVLASEFERDPARGSFPGEPLPPHDPASHLELAARADAFLIAPATANTIAKLAAGAADNLLCSCALAATSPVLVAPAMNNRMYAHAAVQANLSTLRARGVQVIEPGSGRLATIGEHGIGRLAEPEQLLATCEAAMAQSDAARAPDGLAGVRVLVSAGGTREPIDSVRFIGNSSSGRMGVALAQAAQLRGAAVTLVAANLAVPVPPGVECRRVITAEQLRDACEREFDHSDVLLMAAAVADFRPAAAQHGKIAKADRDELVLELVPTADVLAQLTARRRPGQVLVGFAAEHGEGAIATARAKLRAKGLDAIVVNDISRADIGFDSELNEVTILTASRLSQPSLSGQGDGDRAEPDAGDALTVARASKVQVAERILDLVERLRATPAPASAPAS
ncbi:MAG TPA: bifunctional phosphopantothenoylcysteine decarboxylase/phosphopantothenate--cysteine ligase CoaBC [Solirubrobacteraceae bacterium]|nr:bifunctional phosphopantothenoylcysteine decarboxylase/phosphopantothenate--cysteine ligase CoaBC [Solirubrobacteraceae bacterium]